MAPVEKLKSGSAVEKKELQDKELSIAFSIDKELEDAGIDVIALGNVAEVQKSGPSENKGDGSGSNAKSNSKHRGMSASDYAAWRQKLITSEPRDKDMVREIRKTLRKKLAKLEKEEVRLKRKGLKSINGYNDAVAKIRHINRLLSELAEAGYRALKALWLRVVHGIV